MTPAIFVLILLILLANPKFLTLPMFCNLHAKFCLWFQKFVLQRQLEHQQAAMLALLQFRVVVKVVYISQTFQLPQYFVFCLSSKFRASFYNKKAREPSRVKLVYFRIQQGKNGG